MNESQTSNSNNEPVNYRICIQGHLNPSWSEKFFNMNISLEEDGTTTLTGPLPDQAALRTILNRIFDMNVKLISVVWIEHWS